MNLHPLNVLDGLVIIILGWNFVRGFNKGFIEEVVSVVGLVLSAAAAVFVSPLVVNEITKYVNYPIPVYSVAIFIFFSTYVIFKFLASFINSKFNGGFVGFMNNFLGVVFGVLRGYVIASLVVAFISFVAPESYLIKKSFLGGITVPLIDKVLSYVPENLRGGFEERWMVARGYLWENIKKWKEKGGEDTTPPSQP
ncbi:CvpA family protein [Phorcysia thermohydrogeniphila]|uniref:Membrane protein required for colicin V production n=1 Tax=Phorcysia thermohydrogeniphila TaxID=936138 RepID=A0A4R1GHT9_9BACT|nr:CvpA family protein [Phorcysia thermohydrogeniphila]TCK06661.1 membrane protein required for colicin V production [Phorcysia thermohydrogeniphila]